MTVEKLLTVDHKKNLVEINVERMGDHCVLGALSKLDLVQPFSLKEMHVNLTVFECVTSTYLKNMEDLLHYTPDSISVTIHKFI